MTSGGKERSALTWLKEYLGKFGPSTSPTPTKVSAPTPTRVSNTPTPTQVTGISGDFNGDRVVNMADIYLIIPVFGKSKGELGYDEKFDFNKDGTINMADILIIAQNFGKAV